jgi:hypothetical protein
VFSEAFISAEAGNDVLAELVFRDPDNAMLVLGPNNALVDSLVRGDITCGVGVPELGSNPGFYKFLGMIIFLFGAPELHVSPDWTREGP